MSDFGVPSSGKNKSKLILDLSRFVTSRGLKGLTTVLIVDEAHNLSAELLEEIRLLSNLETNEDKLLQIVLVGQPELDEKLDSFDLRPLKQRIALRAHLGPLDVEEVTRYIEERLRIAGADMQSTPLFSAQTIAAVYQALARLSAPDQHNLRKRIDYGLCEAVGNRHSGHHQRGIRGASSGRGVFTQGQQVRKSRRTGCRASQEPSA